MREDERLLDIIYYLDYKIQDALNDTGKYSKHKKFLVQKDIKEKEKYKLELTKYHNT